MSQQRWLRIVPVALIMYTISYIDRTNISLALDPKISSMMKDLFMNDEMKGHAAGIFFFGYVMLQVPGGYFASRWSARKLISLCLVAWGIFAVGCGMSHTFRQFEVMRFFLGVAESAVFPATLVLLSNWFPRSERARANAYWNLCQPLAVAGSAPFTGYLLGAYGWQKMIILEGLIPFVWLPIWWFCIRDHPRDAKWLPPAERDYIETELQRESATAGTAKAKIDFSQIFKPTVLVMVVLYFFHNCAAYGCMTFFTTGLKGQGFNALQYGVLFAIPYAVTAVIMILNSHHSDKHQERHGHVAAMYGMSGVSLILSVVLKDHFWISYGFLCLAIPGPFAAMGPFWTLASEILPRSVMGIIIGLVNAFGNLGGYVGPSFTGQISDKFHNTDIAFCALGGGMLACVALAFMLPKAPIENKSLQTA